MKEEVIEVLENPIVAFFVCLLALLIFGIVEPAYWIYLFLTLSSYLLCDLIIHFFVMGGHGIAQIPALGNHETRDKGHVYIAYFIGIIVSSIVSSVLSELVLSSIESSFDWTITVIGLSFGISGIIYLDMKSKFYKRED